MKLFTVTLSIVLSVFFTVDDSVLPSGGGGGDIEQLNQPSNPGNFFSNVNCHG